MTHGVDADPARALAYIDAGFEGHLADLQSYLKIDNLITHRDRCDEVARRLKDEIERLGGHASILDYGDLPFVYGAIEAGARRTLVIYRNYDVVPPEGADWSAPPFSGRVRRIDGLGECLVSRGACDPKGPLVGTLRAIEAVIRTAGRLPVNLVFLVEGDEQLGSPTLGKVRGGPTRTSIHSGNAAWVASPAWRMVRALATLADENEKVLVEGFYDDVVQTIDAEGDGERHVGGIEDQYDYLRARHVLRFKHDLPPAALCRKYTGSPTFNIGNLLIHRSRPWSRFLLPCEVRAQADLRLVPDQDPEAIVAALRHHLKDHGFPDIEVITHLAYRPWSIDEDHPLVETARRTYRAFGREPEI